MNKPIPKSLHTVTVIVRVARAIQPLHPHATNDGLARLALNVLGYVDTPDCHGLRAAALKQLSA